VTATTASDTVSALSAEPFGIARRPEPLDLRIAAHGRVVWSDTLDRQRYNLYRGDWETFEQTQALTQDPALVPGAEQWCFLDSRVQVDPFAPSPGQLVYYLATGIRMAEDGQVPGVPVPMAESPLGQGPDAEMRENTFPCPDPL
jgi:hypothetical protein